MNEEIDMKGESDMNEEGDMKEEKIEEPVKKKTYYFDITALVLWLVLLWGFLGSLAVTDNPPDQPGIHMFLVLLYFLGFTFVYALFYILALRKGV